MSLPPDARERIGRFPKAWRHGTLTLYVEFDYARSKQGLPVVCLPMILTSGVLADAIELVVGIMNEAGKQHHGQQAMPVVGGEPDYFLVCNVERDKVIESIEDLWERSEFMADTRAVHLKLAYCGDFGDFQSAQARRFGGEYSVDVARRHVEWARSLREPSSNPPPAPLP